MVLETEKENLCINKVIASKREIVTVEGDAIVPDVKPDILSTISVNGNVCIYKKEVLDGKIRIDGCVNTYIIYLADSQDGNVRSINTNIEYSTVINIDNAREGMELNCDVMLRGIECKVLNGRKVNVKATLEINGSVTNKENIDIVTNINYNKNIKTII